jgi:hypothetical protein
LTTIHNRTYAAGVFQRSGRWIVVLMLVTATGGHWALLQSIAWIGMTVQFSRSDSIELALEKTFSGEHPCSLCQIVKEGKQREQQQPALKLELHGPLFLVCCDIDLPPSGEFPLVIPEMAHALRRSLAPPIPPPRAG